MYRLVMHRITVIMNRGTQKNERKGRITSWVWTLFLLFNLQSKSEMFGIWKKFSGFRFQSSEFGKNFHWSTKSNNLKAWVERTSPKNGNIIYEGQYENGAKCNWFSLCYCWSGAGQTFIKECIFFVRIVQQTCSVSGQFRKRFYCGQSRKYQKTNS